MAQQGSLAVTGFDQNIDGTIFGMAFVMPNAFTMNYLDAVLNETTGSNNHVVGCAIYDTSNNLIATSATRNDIATGGYATYRFTGWPGSSIPSGTYWFVALADQGAGNLDLRRDFNAGTSVSEGSVFTGGVFPNPAGISAENFNAALLIDYTEGGGGTSITPSNDDLVIAGTAPTVSVSGAASITPSTGVLALLGRTVDQILTVQSPDADSLVLSGSAPTVSVAQSPISITPSNGTLVIAGSIPSVANSGGSRSIAIDTDALVIQGSAPSVSMSFSGGNANNSRDNRRRGFLIPLYGRG